MYATIRQISLEQRPLQKEEGQIEAYWSNINKSLSKPMKMEIEEPVVADDERTFKNIKKKSFKADDLLDMILDIESQIRDRH